MLFNEYGNKNAPAILLMHGMLQDWHSMYDLLGKLEKDYRLIIPAMDGMYDGSGEFPAAMDIMMKLMGLSEDDKKMLGYTYWNVSPESMKRNLMENYTYHLNPAIRRSSTQIVLWRGENEPYAKKSDRIMINAKSDCHEVVFKNLGHGQMLCLHSDSVCNRLRYIFSNGIDSYMKVLKKRQNFPQLKDLSKYDYIHDGLEDIYGAEKTGQITVAAERHYKKCVRLCGDVSEGEKKHLSDTILIAVSFYKALKELDENSAYKNIRKVMLDMCDDMGRKLGKLTAVPGGKTLFMKLVPKIVEKSFGADCGFQYENLRANDRKCSFNMIKCPYCRFTAMFECPELTSVFCDCDNASYGSLSGICFSRTQTLGHGNEKCDFSFERKDI